MRLQGMSRNESLRLETRSDFLGHGEAEGLHAASHWPRMGCDELQDMAQSGSLKSHEIPETASVQGQGGRRGLITGTRQ